MRASLTVITDELRRLKASGVKSVAVSEEALVALRRAVRANRGPVPVPARAAATEPIAPVRAVTAAVATPVAPRPAAPAPARVAAPPKPKAPTLPPPPILPELTGTKEERWAALKALVAADPVVVSKLKAGKKSVMGVGNLSAKIMLVGEAPGPEEELQGEPFVGPAGGLLNKMIAAMGLTRDGVYISNLMSWRPELPQADGGEQLENRPPTAEEMAYCLPFLKAQIDLVQPALLVGMGAATAKGLLGANSFKTLGEVRGRWRDFCGRPLMITYHPSYILRDPSNRSKRLIWEDLLQVMEKSGLSVTDKQRGYFLAK